MLYSALLLGLISSLHCIAMCGPIAMMLPVSQHNPEKKALQIITYHLGRLTAYAIIGGVFGFLGRGFYLAGIQQQLSIAAGIVMILIAVTPEKILARYNFSKPIFRIISSIKSTLGKRLKNQSFPSLFTIGLLNGFLPCAMVYAALFGAMASQQVLPAITYMIVFGLGTVPLMSSVVYINSWVTLSLRNKIQKIIPYAIVCLGVLFILRGLSLDICYISPSKTDLFVTAQPNCK